MDSYDEILDRLLDEIGKLPYIHRADIPKIDLYMDQLTTFFDDHLSATRRNEDDKILTKTMINNYAKNKLLPPPKGKKYTRAHLMQLAFIYYFKDFLSLQDIRSLTEPLLEHHGQNGTGSDLAEIYHRIFTDVSGQIESARESVHQYTEKSRQLFDDTKDEDQAFLTFFALECMLGTDVYIRKRLMENLIDLYMASADAKKEKKKE